MEGLKCKKARVGLGAVAPKPVRALGVEEMLAGKEVSRELVEACCEQVRREIHPITDIRASGQYRSSMASALLGRMIDQTISGKRE
jgi:carbon-monoxide dehydrogenase medium subunit